MPATQRAPGAPMENHRGVIAEDYHVLQSLGSIDAARAAMVAGPGTDEALLIGLYQSVEIGLHNLVQLLDRAAVHLRDGEVAAAATELHWVRGFHRVLVRLSLAARRVSGGWDAEVPRWTVDGTPAFAEFRGALGRFDRELTALADRPEVDLGAVIAHRSLDDAWFSVLHCARIANHDARVWSANLSASAHPAPEQPPDRVLVSDSIRHAVFEHQLRGDTYFTQFRALHQIPELLIREINDRVEIAIRRIRTGEIAAAVDALDGAGELFDPIEACLPPLVDNLSTRDYHQIRENLGLTSGSHSVSIRFELFTELYEQLIDAIRQYGDAGGADPLARRLHRNVRDLQVFIFSWRDMHLHLPRNNLGGMETKSLTGARDAVGTVRKMRDNAASNDPLARVDKRLPVPTSLAGPLVEYLDGPESSDGLLLSVTGKVTQANFRDVQERTNFFAQPCPFSRPQRRVV
ncbi:hypothetical protein [Micromonospora aurantiaca (nom. illeg.)]|uniref:hypothetical protein n=1 Tax=Micromonospora aurantiaca (nom. illeg.) TaxID=47850 RepID=UPI0037A803C9